MENNVDSQAPRHNDAMRIFPKLHDSPGCCGVCGKMEVSQLCQAVADGVVKCSLGEIATGYMPYWKPHEKSCGCGGQNFISISIHYYQIGGKTLESLGKPTHTMTCRPRYVG